MCFPARVVQWGENMLLRSLTYFDVCVCPFGWRLKHEKAVAVFGVLPWEVVLEQN